MKAVTYLLLLSLPACSTLNRDFKYESHCSRDAYNKIKWLEDLRTKDRRGETSEAEKERMERIRLVNRAYESHLKLPVFECLAEYEATGVKGQLNICSVTEADKNGNIIFLDVNDREKKFNPRLKACIEEKIRAFDFKKYPDVIAVQSINIEFNP